MKKSLFLTLTLLASFGFAHSNFQAGKLGKNQIDPSVLNPLYKYTKGMKNPYSVPAQKTAVAKGKYIVVDTRDAEKCREVEEKYFAGDAEELCTPDAEKPLRVAVIVEENMGRQEFESRYPLSKLMTTDDKSLKDNARNMFFGSFAMSGVIFLLPESVSNWDKEKVGNNFGSQWPKNVKSGPVWDKDSFFINYVGHPVSGASYYLVARLADYSAWESLAYSFLISTFVWEYGVEAASEEPSIQDLIFTPAIGALFGELFYGWTLAIHENGGTVWGSKRLGKTALIFMNPIGEFIYWLNDQFEKSYFKNFFSRSDLGFFSQSVAPQRGGDSNNFHSLEDTAFGLKLTIYFKP